ncbi:PREDICTED: auxin-induced protein 6B [Fragaria vesca subsp. vesca]|uniref:auxin-induced protein 6B n=1 Tax=Fragaria vesca subsp. vesca TaxID=101020 RepID=UPI0002C326FC|nr:PREDICTED: auxin-induced protein 6B [Fragaria vesca subsp. vesca]
MSSGATKCSKIRHIVKLRQLLRRWRSKARMSSANRTPPDVPAGHVAIRVGPYCTRYVMPASYLNHPVFKKLLVQAEEEYGFTNQGPLAIPCDESLFEEVVRYISRSESAGSARFDRHCHVDVRSNFDLLADSRPLLRGFSEKTIW